MNRRLPLLLLFGSAFAPAASAQDGDQAAQLLRASQPGAASAVPESVPGNGFQLSIRFVNTPGHPTNLIPSLGIPFSPGGLPNSAFERPITSENQTQLVVKAKAGTGSFFTQDIYLRNGDAVLQEGAQAPWGAAGELVGPLDEQVGIDNSGNLLITNGTSGQVSFTENDYVVILSPGGQTIVIAREGQPLLNANFPSLTAYAGAVWSGTMTSPILLENGAIVFEADRIGMRPTSAPGDNLIVVRGGTSIGQDVVPTGQANGATATWDNFDFDGTQLTPDGTHILIQGDTDAPIGEDDVLVLDGAVVLQEGFPIPGGPFVEPIDTSGIVKGWLDTSGNWYARGHNNGTEQDWIVRNGVVVAFSDGNDPIVPGSPESWSDRDFTDCFFLFDGNASGAYVIGGVTDAPADANGVLVYDDGTGNRVVLCRENDPIDLDGNGLFDDDRFFNTFGNDDLLVLDNGDIVFSASLRDGTGAAVDQGFFRFVQGAGAAVVRNGSGINPTDFTSVNAPVLGSVWQSAVTLTPTTTGTGFVFGLAPLATPVSLFGGELLVDIFSRPFGDVAGVNGVQSLPLPNNPSLVGAQLFAQGVRLEGTQIVLLNGLDLTLGR